MAYIASGVVGIMFVIYCCYNGYVYVHHPDRYHGIRFTTRNISYIALLTSVSVTVTVVVSKVFPITVFPPVRIAFEGIMVKIAGFIFGPIVGFMSGTLTDLICILFVPSYIHIAYLIVIASFGFLSGCMGSLDRVVGKQKWVIMFFINAFVIAFGAYAISMVYYYPITHGGIKLFAGIFVPASEVVWLVGLGTGTTLAILWLTFLYFIWTATKRNQWRKMLPIIVLATITEYWVTTLISSWGDIAFLSASQGISSGGYAITMIARLVMAPGKIFINTAIIYVVYRAVRPLIDKD